MKREDLLIAVALFFACFSIIGIWLERRKERDAWKNDFDRRYPPRDMDSDNDWFAH
jgi:hypothetical protein